MFMRRLRRRVLTESRPSPRPVQHYRYNRILSSRVPATGTEIPAGDTVPCGDWTLSRLRM